MSEYVRHILFHIEHGEFKHIQTIVDHFFVGIVLSLVWFCMEIEKTHGVYGKKSESNMLVTWNLRRYGNGHQPTVQADPVAWRFHRARLPSFERVPIHLRRDLLSRLGEGWKGTSWENHKIALQPYYNRSQVLRRCGLSLIENFGPLLQKLSKNRQRNWSYPTCQARVSRF